MSRSVLRSCRQAVRETSEALEHPLPFKRRLMLWLHLAICSACRAYARQVRGIDRLVRVRLRAEVPAPLSPAERERLVRRLRDRQDPT